MELRFPFELDRQAIDDVERGANDSDWQPAKDAARQIAFAEDSAIFEGYTAAGIVGIRQGTSNPKMPLPADVRQYPDAIAQALSQLRLVGVNGPYAVLLGAEAYTALAETSDQGYPVLEHVKRLVDDKIIWAPAIDGAFVLTTRGGDFELHIGQDVSIGYLSHTDDAVRLYLQETFTFLLLTSEAAVALTPSAVRNRLRTQSIGCRIPSGCCSPIGTAALKELASAGPAAIHNTVRLPKPFPAVHLPVGNVACPCYHFPMCSPASTCSTSPVT